jgi:aldehyde:ferredoxin oxidoreductase
MMTMSLRPILEEHNFVGPRAGNTKQNHVRRERSNVMVGGFMGKLLFVDLSSGEIREETADEDMCRDFIGGYGIGARILYNRQKGGVDPLGPGNILGFVTGPLTGTPAIGGSRFAVVGKSPLTGGWGDANSGGHFGPRLKFAGFDGVFFTGISEEPVYLLVDNGEAQLKDARHLWGKGTYETEDILKAQYGSNAEVAAIGPGGENLSRMACVITRKGDAAARSGLGAIMGSKRLKAVVARGDLKVPIADIELAREVRKRHMMELKASGFLTQFHVYGTGGHADISALSGDSPVKNWGGIGIIDVPDVSGLYRGIVISNLDRRASCWGCPAGCKGILSENKGFFHYPAGNHRLEYETMGSFGVNCAVTRVEPLEMASHLCNDSGIDTISAGSVIAFAMECYENGIISTADTDGIELAWGDESALIAMLEKIIGREGFGDVLADGVKIAADRIGRGAEQFAVHIGGQEPAAHDPKLPTHPYQSPSHPTAAVYKMDATPGRHTQGFGPSGFLRHLNNAMGTCLIIFLKPSENDITVQGPYVVEMMRAVTGIDRSREDLLKVGERIANMRHVFTLREGVNPLDRFMHPRLLGRPPQKEGPLAGISLDLEAETYWNLGALDWDRVTTKPSMKKLLELGLEDVAADLWPSEEIPAMGGPGEGTKR